MGCGSSTSHGKGKSHEFKVMEGKKIPVFLSQFEKHHLQIFLLMLHPRV